MSKRLEKAAIVKFNSEHGIECHFDQNGEKIYEKKSSINQFFEKLENAKRNGFLLQLGACAFAINANHIATICMDTRGYNLSFINHQGKTIYEFDLMGSGIEKNRLAEYLRPAFIKAIGQATFLNRQIIMQGQPNIEASRPTVEPENPLKKLPQQIKSVVFGQDEPVDKVVRAIWREAADLKRHDKPVGSFIFLGPSGVGKTELAKQLAKKTGRAYGQFNMSEYAESHAALRLVGAPPSYIGFEKGGQLTNFAKANPKSVILFDEIEKAHRDVPLKLLQVLEEATLTDGSGQIVSFADCIIIMTSNLGEEIDKEFDYLDQDAEFSDGDPRNERAVRKFFKPEFLNRVDSVIRFNPLDKLIMHKIVDKILDDLKEKLKGKKTELNVADIAKTYLVGKAFDPKMNARPLQRLIQMEIEDPLAEEILFGKLVNGGKVVLTLDAAKGKIPRLTFAFNATHIPINDNDLTWVEELPDNISQSEPHRKTGPT